MIRLKSLFVIAGETIAVSNQWAAETESRDTTVSSSAWAYTGAGALSGASLATPLATVKLAPTGSGQLRNTVTLADGEVLVAVREVSVAC